MENFKWLGIDLRLKILICIFSILFSCKDNKQEFGESWISLFNNVKMDEKAVSDRHYSSDGTLTFATFNSDLVPYNRKQAPEVLKTYLQLTLNSEPVFCVRIILEIMIMIDSNRDTKELKSKMELIR